MALPTLNKTWQRNINNVHLPEAMVSWHQKLLLAIVNGMLGFSSNPWTVAGSSDSSTGAMDGPGTNRWDTYVLGVQVCFNLVWTQFPFNQIFMHMYASPGGLFLGGDESNRPTATDEYDCQLFDGGGDDEVWWCYINGVPTENHIWHMWHSEDGEVTRVIGYAGGLPHTIWRFEAFQHGLAGQNPLAFGCGFLSGPGVVDRMTVTTQEDGVRGHGIMRSRHDSYDLDIYCTGVGRTGLNLVERTSGSLVEEISGEAWFTEIGYVSPTVGGRGPKGTAYDMWWGQYQVINNGDTYPNDAADRRFVQIGSCVLPWTGDATLLVIT